MDIFSKTPSQFPKKHHRCISLESGQTLTKKSYPKTPLDLPRFFPRRYSTPELAMRKHALKYQRDDSHNEQPISNKSCQTDILGLDKYLQRSPPRDVNVNSAGHSATLRSYKKPLKKPKVRSVAVHCERRRMTFAAFKGCQKFKHVYKRKISLPHQSSTATSTDDGRWDNGVLPKLRPDRTETERPVVTKAVPVVKLPRIPTKDVKPEPDRMDDGGGGGTKLAKLTRPQSTGSSGGGGSSGAERKLAYFRASSAPKIDSRYYTLITAPQQSEREQLSTGGSSDTADTTLDMSFKRQQSENAAAPAMASTTAGTTSSTTRTVSTSTTFTEPIFPIVFSCESVLRHPLDGGYVSHTESHRFSVHYVPTEDNKAVTTDDTDNGSARSSLVFTSAGACQNERCLTGDSISVTVGGGGGGGGCGGNKPDDSAALSRYDPSTSNAAGERRLVIESSNADVQFETVVHNASDEKMVGGGDLPIVGQSPADHCCPSKTESHRSVGKTTEIKSKDDQEPASREYNAIKVVGLHVLGKNDNVCGNVNAFENATTAVPPIPANKTIDDFGENGSGVEGGTALKSYHAHTDDMPSQSDERNNEQLTQNNQNIDSDRTVSNQSPKFDGTSVRVGEVERQNYSKPVENDAECASELDLPRANVELAERSITAANTDTTAAVKDPLSDSSDQSPDSTTVMSPPGNGRKLHSCESTAKQHETGGMVRKNTGENTNRPNNTRTSYLQHGESTENRHSEHNNYHKRNIPARLYDHVSRIRNYGSEGNDSQHCGRGEHVDRNPKDMQHTVQSDKTAHSFAIGRHRHQEPVDAQSRGDGRISGSHNMSSSSTADINKKTAHRSSAIINNQHSGSFRNQVDDTANKRVGQSDADNREYVAGLRSRESVDSRLPQRSSLTTQRVVAGDEDGANACRKCTNISTSYKKNKMQTGTEGHDYFKVKKSAVESDSYNHHGDSAQRGAGGAVSDKNEHSTCKRRLESVDEMTESKESNYVGGFLFGNAIYKKQPQKYIDDMGRNVRDGDDVSFKHEYCDDSKKVNLSSKPNFEYYHDYVPVTGHSPRDEDCTVFADVPWNSGDNKRRVEHPNDRAYSTTATAAPAATQTSYYSQLDRSYGDDKNTDSDESLTDSLEDGCKYEGTAVSYFLSLNGQKSAVTFTLKMPNTLENRLNRRHSRLKKHLHVSTTVRKTSTRVRTRHKSCQTLWTEEKGVQVQRGSTANTGRKPVDDRRVLETLLAGIAYHHVSENQIRVVDGQKMVSEGNQTERIPEPPTDRQTQTTRDAAAGPKTPDNTGGHSKGQSHSLKKFSSDNALMVGVVRQNQYKGKEALDGAKNDQLLTLSKGWINFYTLRADSADTDAQGTEVELHDNDDDIKTEHDSQQYTVHVQAIPEPVTLPVVHVPSRNNSKLTKMCSTVKHLPKLVQTETNNHHCTPHLGTTGNGWCVSVDGPNNMHMKVSLLPDKSDNKTSERFDHNEENKLESRRLALQRKNNYMRRPYRNIKRTQSTPRDMFSADVSRTESALSAESKYIETVDTQLLIHKARRRLSQEWDTRIQNGGVTESVQLVVTGDSVSSRASQHYGNRGHQHCSFRRQSRRI